MTNGDKWLELSPSGLKCLSHVYCNNECIEHYALITIPHIYIPQMLNVRWPFFILSLSCRGSFHRYHNNKTWEGENDWENARRHWPMCFPWQSLIFIGRCNSDLLPTLLKGCRGLMCHLLAAWWLKRNWIFLSSVGYSRVFPAACSYCFPWRRLPSTPHGGRLD